VRIIKIVSSPAESKHKIIHAGECSFPESYFRCMNIEITLPWPPASAGRDIRANQVRVWSEKLLCI